MSSRIGHSSDNGSSHSCIELDIHLGPVPKRLEGARRVLGALQVTDREILGYFSHDARLLVRDGCSVTLEVPDVPEWSGDRSWTVHGWGMLLASLQRGELSIHATTVAIGESVLALAGHSGAGKSTTGMAAKGRGHTLLVDDLSLIDFRHDGAWVVPYARNVHLLPEAADALGLDFATLPLLAGARAKSAYEPVEPPPDPRRIDGIVILNPSDTVTEVGVREVRGAGRVQELIAHTSRSGLVPALLGPDAYFRSLARLAADCRVLVLTRPLANWTMDRVLDTLEHIAEDLPPTSDVIHKTRPPA